MDRDWDWSGRDDRGCADGLCSNERVANEQNSIWQVGRRSGRFFLSPARPQQARDLSRLGKAAQAFLGEDEFAVPANLEHPARRADQGDLNIHLFADFSRQTAGFRFVVSLAAVFDADLHWRAPPKPDPAIGRHQTRFSGFNPSSSGRTKRPSSRTSRSSNQTCPPPASGVWIWIRSQWMPERLLLSASS